MRISKMCNGEAARVLVRMCVVILSLAIICGASKLIIAKETIKRITIITSNDTLGSLEPCG